MLDVVFCSVHAASTFTVVHLSAYYKVVVTYIIKSNSSIAAMPPTNGTAVLPRRRCLKGYSSRSSKGHSYRIAFFPIFRNFYEQFFNLPYFPDVFFQILDC